jgi:hypothetical protein
VLRAFIAGCILLVPSAVLDASQAALAGTAIVIRDRTALRAAPRAGAQMQAMLWRGELLEIRGARLDYLQVYDFRRERGGFVHTSLVSSLTLTAQEAPELLSVVRFVRDTAGAEALGIGYVAAYVQSAPAEILRGAAGIEAMDALGTFADRLARRASTVRVPSHSAETTLAAHLDVAARYGVRYTNHEYAGRMVICYDGEAFQRVLATNSAPAQRARAVLGLTRAECMGDDLSPLERARITEWQAQVLDAVEVAALPAYVRNRVLIRRASALSTLAFQRARQGQSADAAAARAITALAAVDKAELPDADRAAYGEAALRVSASRWAAVAPAPAPERPGQLRIRTAPGEPGETCVSLIDGRRAGGNVLAQRCTYGIVWTASETHNREENALTLAVQPLAAWRELWLFRKQAKGWTVRVLPPAASEPEIGYVEFAGWVPGGTRMLVAREARSEGRVLRRFEIVRLDTLAVVRRAGRPGMLGAFRRWQDPSWKNQTLSMR